MIRYYLHCDPKEMSDDEWECSLIILNKIRHARLMYGADFTIWLLIIEARNYFLVLAKETFLL